MRHPEEHSDEGSPYIGKHSEFVIARPVGPKGHTGRRNLLPRQRLRHPEECSDEGSSCIGTNPRSRHSEGAKRPSESPA